MKRIGALELGGTKAIVGGAVLDSRRPSDAAPDVIGRQRIPTTSPAETLARCVAALRSVGERMGGLDAVGVASFGPLQLDPACSGYGGITTTPKAGWQHTDIVGRLADALGVPVAIDTDVNGAALAEGRWGACRGAGGACRGAGGACCGLDSHVYVTVGTGVGVGLVVHGRPQHGLVHPEGGHLLVRRDPARDPYTGHCPYHGDCLEGLVSGPAIAARLGRSGDNVADDDPVWDLVGDYLGQMVANLLFIVSPQRIVMGGGVGSRPAVLAATRAHARRWIGGYIAHPRLDGDLSAFILPPGLGEQSGLLGAVALADGV